MYSGECCSSGRQPADNGEVGKKHQGDDAAGEETIGKMQDGPVRLVKSQSLKGSGYRHGRAHNYPEQQSKADEIPA